MYVCMYIYIYVYIYDYLLCMYKLCVYIVYYTLIITYIYIYGCVSEIGDTPLLHIIAIV